MFDAGNSPVNRFLGTEVKLTEVGHVIVHCPIQESFIQETGVVQGGILSAVADQAAGLCALSVLKNGEMTAGIEFKVNFLTPARFPGLLVADAKMKKRGGKIAVVETDLASDDQIVLTGIFTFLIWTPNNK